MTVEDLRRKLSMEEYHYWVTYYNRIAQREEMERAKAKARKGRRR